MKFTNDYTILPIKHIELVNFNIAKGKRIFSTKKGKRRL